MVIKHTELHYWFSTHGVRCALSLNVLDQRALVSDLLLDVIKQYSKMDGLV